MVDDEWGALVPDAPLTLAGATTGPLLGTTFVTKDLFDIAGMPTGAGSPARRATAAPAVSTAVAVGRLLAAGATLVGRARMDELAYGLSGRNDLDGSPRNPAAPGHATGGSSSGSAAAVAGRLADLGLGTDTGGSIRVPASHCGLFALRPTHGRVPCGGVVPLGPSFDTVGWLAATAEGCAAAGAVLLDGFEAQPAVDRIVLLVDVLATVDPAVEAAVRGAVHAHAARIGAAVDSTALTTGDELATWRDAFRVLQGAEAWAEHGRWLTTARPALGTAVRARFETAARLTADEVAAAASVRDQARRRLRSLLDAGTGLAVPAAAGPPLPVDANAATVDRTRQATLAITCLAPLAGLPASAQPIPASPLRLPTGWSLIGGPGTDEALLASMVGGEGA